jgi:hypothetical protein
MLMDSFRSECQIEFQREMTNVDKTSVLIQNMEQVSIDQEPDLQLEVYEDKEYDVEEVKYINFMTKKRAIKPEIIRTLIYKVPEIPKPKQVPMSSPSITPVTSSRQSTQPNRNRNSLNVTALDMAHYNTKNQVNYEKLDLSQFNPIGANDQHIHGKPSLSTNLLNKPLPDEIQPLKTVMEQKQLQQAKYKNTGKKSELYQLKQTNTLKTNPPLSKPEIVIEIDEPPSTATTTVTTRQKRSHKSTRASIDAIREKRTRGVLIDDDDDIDDEDEDDIFGDFDFDYSDSDDEIQKRKAKRQRTKRLSKNESFNEKFYNFLNKTRIDLKGVDEQLREETKNKNSIFDRVFSKSFMSFNRQQANENEFSNEYTMPPISKLTKEEIEKISENFKVKTGIVLKECRVTLDRLDYDSDKADKNNGSFETKTGEMSVTMAKVEEVNSTVIDDIPMSKADEIAADRLSPDTVDDVTQKSDETPNEETSVKFEKTSPQPETTNLNQTFDVEQAKKRRRRSKNSRLSLDLARLDDSLLRTSTSSNESSTRLTRSRVKLNEKTAV